MYRCPDNVSRRWKTVFISKLLYFRTGMLQGNQEDYTPERAFHKKDSRLASLRHLFWTLRGLTWSDKHVECCINRIASLQASVSHACASLVCIHTARHESDLCLTGSNSEFYSLHTGEFRVVKKKNTHSGICSGLLWKVRDNNCMVKMHNL